MSRIATVLVWVCVVNGLAAGQNQYLVANDDAPTSNNVSFYTIGTTGSLTLKKNVLTGGSGIAGGYFATNRLGMLDSGGEECVFASNAATGDIVGINVNTLALSDSASGSATDSGAANGIGIAMNSQYLYAGFTSSNTIGTFQLRSGCTFTFVNDIPVAGMQGGFIDGMAVSGNMLVITYGDGSIESFNIASGTPVSNGDLQNSTAYQTSNGSTYPNSVEITQDGRYAIFGDTSTSTMVEVSSLSSGKLSETTAYSVGSGINSSNIMLSPDETLLYISNTQGDQITAAWFNKTTGALSAGCASGPLKGYGSEWSYLAALGLSTNSGTGGTLYVAEFGNPYTASYIGMVQVTSTGSTCTLQEVSGSPALGFNLGGLLSVGAFPPRSF